MSPAMTSPLSSTRSRMSTRPCDRDGLTNSGNQCSRCAGWLPQAAQRSEVDVEILVGQPEDRLQFVHPLIQLQERQAKAFDLGVAQRATIHPSNRLVLQNFA